MGLPPRLDSLRLTCAEFIERRALGATWKEEAQECAGETALWCTMVNTAVTLQTAWRWDGPGVNTALRHGTTEGTHPQPSSTNTAGGIKTLAPICAKSHMLTTSSNTYWSPSVSSDIGIGHGGGGGGLKEGIFKARVAA